jgi:hypothetical protein
LRGDFDFDLLGLFDLAMDVLFQKCAALSRVALLSQAGAKENG